MYTILTALGVGIVSGVIWTLLGLWKTWAMGIVLGLIVFVVTFALVSRRTAKRIEPRFQHIQKQIQGGNAKLAAAAIAILFVVLNFPLNRGLLGAGRGCYLEALQYVAAATEGPHITVTFEPGTGSLNGKVLAWYSRFLADDQRSSGPKG